MFVRVQLRFHMN